MMRSAVALFVFFFGCINPAGADLYRWVDPETGSVKYSSYPPPWYGDESKQRRAPKVEFIPAANEPAAKAETPGKAPDSATRRRDAPTAADKPAKEDSK
jgi:hypothetical protein